MMASRFCPDLVANFGNPMKFCESRDERVNAHANSHWRCSVRRVGLPLALFAMVIQAVISFGHHHFDVSGLRSAKTAIAASLRSQPAFAASPRGDRHGRQAPMGPSHAPCLICMAIDAAAPPMMDALTNVLPLDVKSARIAMPPVASISAPLRAAAFNSRAPPPLG
jgi:hypothetical protein